MKINTSSTTPKVEDIGKTFIYQHGDGDTRMPTLEGTIKAWSPSGAWVLLQPGGWTNVSDIREHPGGNAPRHRHTHFQWADGPALRKIEGTVRFAADPRPNEFLREDF